MALTFPRDMPDTRLEKFNFTIARFDESAPEASGYLGGLQTGFPRWELTAAWGPGLLPGVSEEWQAFVDSLDGQAGLFYGRSYTRDYPETYPRGFDGLTRAGGGAFPGAGTATSWSVSVDRKTVTLNGLPTSFWLIPGDLIGFAWGEDDINRACVRVMERHSTGGDGSGTWEVRPALSRAIPAGATAYLHQPSCVMRMDTARSTLDGMGSDRVLSGTLVAVQHLVADLAS